MYFKVSKKNAKLYAIDIYEKDNPDVPMHSKRAAIRDGKAIQRVLSKTGKPRYTFVPLEEYDKAMTALNTDTFENITDIPEFIRQSPALIPATFKVANLTWRHLVRNVLRGDHVLLRGDAGCGKTELALLVAKVLKRPFFDINMGGTQDPRGALVGNVHFKPETGTYFSEAHFIRAIQTPNAVIRLDELSRMHPDAGNVLMPVLDKKIAGLRVDEHMDSPFIPVAPGVCFIGTANVGSEYTATRTLDKALLERFEQISLEPLSKDDEISLLNELFPKMEKTFIERIASFASETRNTVKNDNDPKISSFISTRFTIRMANLISDGFTFEEACDMIIFPQYSAVGGADSESAAIRLMAQKYFSTDFDNKATPFGNDPNGGRKPPWADIIAQAATQQPTP